MLWLWMSVALGLLGCALLGWLGLRVHREVTLLGRQLADSARRIDGAVLQLREAAEPLPSRLAEAEREITRV